MLVRFPVTQSIALSLTYFCLAVGDLESGSGVEQPNAVL